MVSLQPTLGLDPTNDDAKYNLEYALQRSRGVQLTEGGGGQNPSPGGSGSTGELLALVVTGSLLSVIPLIAAFLMLQRYWQSGLTAGSVKE